ncbi:RHS repeat-associated core domain-containing protein [Clostridium sp. SYSU_GA19001]|uniref:RHS repeat-associated core domain-containing protein n=1 Tax=Clostridium caldaquaticum TaxID=2940653 RepID=UPI002076DACF|nr:RHS repeat-associated core domain-containing protein [Clostridium caldaquaticum]
MASANPLRYAGYRYDEATGLYYLMARYYDANVGRFITRDTFHGFEVDILSLNQYTSAQNNPVIYADPSGHVVVNVVGAVIGAGLGGLLGKAVADYYKLTGWKRNATIAGFAVGGAALGWFAGSVIKNLAGMLMTYVLTNPNYQLAQKIANKYGGTLENAAGDGWVIRIQKITLRIMNSGGGRTNYWRLSIGNKGTVDKLGNFSNDRALTHIDITKNSFNEICRR